MNSLKTLLLVAVMTAVGYGVYASLHKKPEAEPPVALPENWTAGPSVQLSTGEPGISPSAGTDALPQFLQGNTGTDNPLLKPGAGSSPIAVDPVTAAMNPPLESQASAAVPAVGYPTTGGAPAAADTASALAGPSPFPAAPPAQAVYPSTGSPSALAVQTAAANPTAAGLAKAADLDTDGGSSDTDPQNAEMRLMVARAFDAAQVQADVGRLAEAHLELSRWYGQPNLTPQEERQLQNMLDRLAGSVIYSHKHHLLEPPYLVQPGDTLQRVAELYRIPWPLLAKVNGLNDSGPLTPGDTLKVFRGPFNAVVDLQKHRLTLSLQERYAGSFAIGVGRDLPVYPGEFEVRAVAENPIYRGPDLVVQPGDANNPYGRYWIDLGNQMGIHGTNDPANLGRDGGRGCISVSPEDIEHLHDILAVGSKVTIQR